ncbi:MAG: TylF/MycF/NovP-related O-methyltransferase [Methanobacterium sp.]
MRHTILKIGYKISTSGIKPLKSLSIINDSLKYGDWINNHEFVKLESPRINLYNYINENILCDCPIDYLEFGVFKGESLNAWATINKNKSSRFYGFDWFYGLPEEWVTSFNDNTKKGTFSTNGELPDIEDIRVKLVQGLFQQSLPEFLKNFHPKNRLVIHLDADLYSSTLYVLTRINDLLSSNTILIFDEFASIGHEFRAFMDYCSAYGRDYTPVAACLPYCTQMAILLK